jgi:hypothetical protein
MQQSGLLRMVVPGFVPGIKLQNKTDTPEVSLRNCSKPNDGRPWLNSSVTRVSWPIDGIYPVAGTADDQRYDDENILISPPFS